MNQQNKSFLPMVEVKATASESDGVYTFEGYASVFGVEDSYGDIIQRGAYDYVLNEIKEGRADMPVLFFGHQHNSVPIGKFIELSADDYGLKFKAELTKGNSVAEDVRLALGHGSLEGMSIGFFLQQGDFERRENGGRIINRVSELPEISVVAIPANRDSKIDLASVKSRLDEVEDIRSLEKLLRDECNFSREASKAFIAKAKAILQREADQEEVKADQQEQEAKAYALAAYLNL